MNVPAGLSAWFALVCSYLAERLRRLSTSLGTPGCPIYLAMKEIEIEWSSVLKLTGLLLGRHG